MQKSQHNYILILNGKNINVEPSSPTNKLDFKVKDNSIKLEKILKASAYAINTLRQYSSTNNKKDITNNSNEKEFSKNTAKNIINDLILLYKLNKPEKQQLDRKSSSSMSTTSSSSSSNDLNDLLNKAALKLNERPNMNSSNHNGNPFSPRLTEEDLEVVNLTSSSHLMLPVSSHFQRRDFVKPNGYNSEDEPSIASSMNDEITSASNISKSLNLVDKLTSTLFTQNLQNRPAVITTSVEKKMEDNFLQKIDEILDQHFPTQNKSGEEDEIETNIIPNSQTESEKSNKINSIDDIKEKLIDDNDVNNNNNVSISDSRSTVSPVEPLFIQLDQSVTASCCLEPNYSENIDNECINNKDIDIESVSISKSSSSSSITSSTSKEPENPIETKE